MPVKTKVMYLNFDELTLLQLIFDGLKIKLYHEHLPDNLEKYTRFSKFTIFLSISYVCVNGKAICR